MPFVRKADSPGSQPSTGVRKIFIGRTSELLFFKEHILKDTGGEFKNDAHFEW